MDVLSTREPSLPETRFVARSQRTRNSTRYQRTNGVLLNCHSQRIRNYVKRRGNKRYILHSGIEEGMIRVSGSLTRIIFSSFQSVLVLEAKRSEKVRLELELKNVQRQIAMLRRSGRRFEVRIIIAMSRAIDFTLLVARQEVFWIFKDAQQYTRIAFLPPLHFHDITLIV